MTTTPLRNHPLSELWELEPGPEVLSVYLPLALGRSVQQGHRAALSDALKVARAKLDEESLPRFDAEAERVMEFLENGFEPQGRTLIVFSSQPRDLWLEAPVQSELPPQVHFGPAPLLRPLEQEPTIERVAFAVVDREQARVLTLRLGSVELDKHTRDYFPRKAATEGRKHQRTDNMGDPRQGGDASAREERSREAWADEHFEKTCDLLRDIDADTPISHLIIGGTRENVLRFQEAMPGDLRSRVSGDVAIEIDRPVDEFIGVAAAFLRDQRDREDMAILTEALEGAAAGGTGAGGWDDVLTVLTEGRARDVLVAAGADRQGARCPEDHYVALEAPTCPMCGVTAAPVDSLLDVVDEMARNTGASLRVVQGPAAEALAAQDGIAARLRY